ncbi:MAG TPA: hypothetical protein VIG64_07570 [Actinomycetota bacterium]|jgi:hypothetical protein
MDSDQAGTLFQVLAAAVAITGIVSGLLVHRRSKKHDGRYSILPLLLIIAVALVSIAVLHVLIGSLIQEIPRAGLWAEGTISALPSSVVALGTTFLTVWAVLWTAKTSLEVGSRGRERDQAEARRFEIREVMNQLDKLEALLEPISERWLGPRATRAKEVWRVITETWDDLLDGALDQADTSQSPNAEQGKHPGSVHQVTLPADPNVFLSWGDFSASDPGCVHFQAAVYPKLPLFYERAQSVAVNQPTAAAHVRSLLTELAANLDRYGLPTTELLVDARLLSLFYPEVYPKQDEMEGRGVLAKNLAWVGVINIAESRWAEDYIKRATAHGIFVERPWSLTQGSRIWDSAKKARDYRTTLKGLLERDFDLSHEELGKMSRLDFWDRISKEPSLRVHAPFSGKEESPVSLVGP